MKRRKWATYTKNKYPVSSSQHPHNFLVPLVEQVRDGVVSIVTEDRAISGDINQILREFLVNNKPPLDSFAERSFGSGFVFHPNGYILTSEHVIGKSKSIYVKLYNGLVYEAERVYSDRTRDYAVVKIDADCRLKPLRLGSSAQTKVGEWVISIGSPHVGKGKHVLHNYSGCPPGYRQEGKR